VAARRHTQIAYFIVESPSVRELYSDVLNDSWRKQVIELINPGLENILQQLSLKDAVENIDCKTREDCSDDLNTQSVPLGQHFAATVLRFHKPVGIKHVRNAVGSKEYEDSASQNLFPKTVVVHSPVTSQST